MITHLWDGLLHRDDLAERPSRLCISPEPFEIRDRYFEHMQEIGHNFEAEFESTYVKALPLTYFEDAGNQRS